MAVELIDIRTVESNGLGRLSFFEANRDVPFEIKRVYYIYGTPEEAQRGGHAHRQLTQMLVCLYGAIEIVLDDGQRRERVLLDNPSKGLIVRDMTWREMIWKQADSVLGVAASSYYDEADYIRDYGTFLDEVRIAQGGGSLNDSFSYSFPLAHSEQGLFLPGDAIRRLYWTYNVPMGVLRGGHAHRELAQTLCCPFGSVEVLLDDGRAKGSFLLDDPAKQLYVGPMIWHDMLWREKGSVLLVAASDYYRESDYIRNREVFNREVMNGPDSVR